MGFHFHLYRRYTFWPTTPTVRNQCRPPHHDSCGSYSLCNLKLILLSDLTPFSVRKQSCKSSILIRKRASIDRQHLFITPLPFHSFFLLHSTFVKYMKMRKIQK